MIKTFKVKHNRDLSVELRKALQVSIFALKHKCTSSAQVKQFGLKSIISNQIIRKIIRNKRIKSIHVSTYWHLKEHYATHYILQHAPLYLESLLYNLHVTH